MRSGGAPQVAPVAGRRSCRIAWIVILIVDAAFVAYVNGGGGPNWILLSQAAAEKWWPIIKELGMSVE
jgi:hypothetical protein